ncbi:MAG: hypothetical protein JW809_19805 [Pirellulales bacterium]|nr:hypothetical protein [Pirellulales bacterium]
MRTTTISNLTNNVAIVRGIQIAVVRTFQSLRRCLLDARYLLPRLAGLKAGRAEAGVCFGQPAMGMRRRDKRVGVTRLCHVTWHAGGPGSCGVWSTF